MNVRMQVEDDKISTFGILLYFNNLLQGKSQRSEQRVGEESFSLLCASFLFVVEILNSKAGGKNRKNKNQSWNPSPAV